MRVIIDARLELALAGGVAVAVRSLIQGLGYLTDGEEEYLIIVDGEAQVAWLSPILAPNQRLVSWPRPVHGPARRLFLRAMRPVARYLRRTIDRREWPEVPISDGFHEQLGGDVLHVPTQDFTLCSIPTIYNPHDLQHLQFPQFFRTDVLARRETVYPAGCHFSQAVVVGSQWIKDDIIRRYGTDPSKIHVIHEAAPTQAAAEPSPADLLRVRESLGLSLPFVLFPGVTWPHKNHLRLLEALAHLRDDDGLDVGLVCTGARYPRFWPRVERAIEEFQLGDRVRFLGHVPEVDLRALYRSAACLVLPSLYEASSLPIFEAWLEGLPVACSNATALPEQVQDAALLFDPTDVSAMAQAIASLVLDPRMSATMRQRGTERLRMFDLILTAKTYRALYRRTAGSYQTEEDERLLKWNVMQGSPRP